MPELKLVDKVTRVPKEANDLALCIQNVVICIFDQLADGWQPGEDVSAILLNAVAQVPQAIDGLDLLDDEFEKWKSRFAAAFGIMGFEIGDAVEQYMKKRKELPTPQPTE